MSKVVLQQAAKELQQLHFEEQGINLNEKESLELAINLLELYKKLLKSSNIQKI